MKKTFIFNLIFLFTLNILVKPVWLWMDMNVQREVGDAYGMYFPLLNLSLILSVLLDLGISNYNNRKVAAHPDRFQNYFSSIITLRFFLAFLFLGILMLIGFIFSYSAEEMFYLFILGINQVMLSTILYLRSNFTALGRFKVDSFISVLDRVLMIGGVVYLLYLSVGQSMTVESFIWVQFYGYLITVLTSFVVLIFVGKPKKLIWNTRFVVRLLKKSAPYAVIVLLMSAYNSSDSIMIGKLLDDGVKENALYAQSFRILTALNNYAYLFAVLLLPMFSRMLKLKEAVGKLLSLSGGLLIYGVTAFVIVSEYYSFDVISFCYGEFAEGVKRIEVDSALNIKELNASKNVFIVLIIGIIPMSFNYCYGALITASGKMKLLNKIAAVSLGLNIVLNFSLIPIYGAMGAALASVCTQGFSAVIQMFYAYKEFSLPLSWLKPFRFVLGLLVVFISVEYLSYNFSLELRLLLIGLVVIIGSLISIKFEGVKGLLKSVKKSS